MASFQTFVAWRYLLVRERKVSKAAICVAAVGLLALVVSRSLLSDGAMKYAIEKWALVDDSLKAYIQRVAAVGQVGAALLFLAVFFGGLRWIFTFFTTVPIGGVWIGTGALVCVLSVMSGFESDLRAKILGSNAHIQITKENGDFTEWREIRQKVEAMKGVLASTPYATSEVVIAASDGNGQNVIIKGIDPDSVGKVTDLVSDLDDPQGLRRMLPLDQDPSMPDKNS